jgi:hypothetical protein
VIGKVLRGRNARRLLSSNRSRPGGMIMPVLMKVTRAGGARLRIAHDAQNARAIRLQHIDNNHPYATASHPQPTLSSWAALEDLHAVAADALPDVDLRRHQAGRRGAATCDHRCKRAPLCA